MYITSLFTRLLFEAFSLSHSNVYTAVDDDGMACTGFFAALHYVNPEKKLSRERIFLLYNEIKIIVFF